MGIGDAALPAVMLAEAQAFLRVETDEEEALIDGLVRSASALCEAFIGQVVVARSVVEMLGADTAWQRLRAMPVRSIDLVERVAADGSTVPLSFGDYAIDIDAEGGGWVRLTGGGGTGRLRVSATAGIASSRSDVPELLRQGIVRLVGHLFANRDGSAGEPPAAVTALWRPYRRMRLA